VPAATLPGGSAAPQCALAAGPHHVAVVVRHGDGWALRQCVGFAGDSISGEEALNGSGIQWQSYDYGGSLGRGVCQVDGEPATPPSGFNRDNCLSSNGRYWGVKVSRGGGAWGGSPRGVSSTRFSDGDALGLAYGDGSESPASPAGICPAPPPATAPPTPPSAAGPAPSGVPPSSPAIANGGGPGSPSPPLAAAAGGDPPPREASSGDSSKAAEAEPQTGLVLGSRAQAREGPHSAIAAPSQVQPPMLGWLSAAALALALLAGLAVQIAMPKIRR
jgi:hypothetical protein